MKITEKYPNLYNAVKEYPRVQLRVYPTEYRGDDCGSLQLPEYENTNLALFLKSQKIAVNGFIENYCLEEEKEKIRKFRDNKALKKAIENILSNYLQISIEEFNNLSLKEQLNIISKINQNENNLNEKVNQLVKKI